MRPISSSDLAANAASRHDQRLEQAAQAFEAIFLRDMIGAMRKAELGDDLLGNSGSGQFRDMMDDKVAEKMAQSQGVGIAAMLIAQWSKTA